MRILLVEDNPGDVRLMQEYLLGDRAAADGFQLVHEDRLARGLERLAEADCDAVLLDLSLPDSQGIETLVRARAAAPGIPIVVLTSLDDESLGMQLIQNGAEDYLVKGEVTAPLLKRSLRYSAERQRMKRVLRENTNLLQSVLDGVADGVVMADEQGRFQVWNAAAERIVGLGPADVPVPRWSEHYALFLQDRTTLYPPERLPLVRAMRGESVADEVLFLRSRDRPEGIWLSVNAEPLRDETGRLKGGVAAFRDITAQKQAEEALRASEARFRAIMDNSPALIFLKDTQGRYLEVNRRFEQVFQVTNRSVAGKTDDELFPPAQAASYRANDRQVWAIGAPMEFEETAVHDDGVHTSLVVKFPLKNADGRCDALCGFATDITDRKRVEAERQRLVNDRLLLLESTGEGIYGLDLQGRCTFMNRAAARMLGYEPEDLLGQCMHESIHHSRPDGSRYPIEECRIYQSFRSGQGCQVDDEVLWRQDGTAFPVQYSAFPMMERDMIVGAVVTFTDITERKRSEEHLQRTLSELRTLSQRLDVVQEEERTRIARELHDELGVRLTCLKLDLARLQSLMGGSLFPREQMEEKVRAMMADVDATIASVQRLVVELRPGILDDLGLVAAIEWQCQDFERRSGTRCVCKAPQEQIHLDRSHATAAFRICQEALTNVARHAKATAVRVSIEQVNGELWLDIQDDGRGIRTEQLRDSASLGLLGMRERARGLGGRLEIAARPGKGTTVTLRLPLT
jgi:PAS domain S-box-containing protein